MWQVAAGVIQIIYLIIKNKFEKDEELRKKREGMRAETEDAIKSRDVSRINNVITRMRHK